jgi:hypothetical protein
MSPFDPDAPAVGVVVVAAVVAVAADVVDVAESVVAEDTLSAGTAEVAALGEPGGRVAAVVDGETPVEHAANITRRSDDAQEVLDDRRRAGRRPFQRVGSRDEPLAGPK